ncbi:hypothetical protein Acr_00g0030230 [Actinidia rufa]|uniref:Uncharacterized protein n=1 Tax=Actinidia rufa TaxID=165716 RepID=A0A7J0DGM0_9ERIC|nr:hypothetical protein Acr_00g0030230 [Actinidia rufa]
MNSFRYQFFENHIDPLPRSTFKIDGIVPSLLEESFALGVGPSGFLCLLDIVLQLSEHFDPRHKVPEVSWGIECQVFPELLPNGKPELVAHPRQLLRVLLDFICVAKVHLRPSSVWSPPPCARRHGSTVRLAVHTYMSFIFLLASTLSGILGRSLFSSRDGPAPHSRPDLVALLLTISRVNSPWQPSVSPPVVYLLCARGFGQIAHTSMRTTTFLFVFQPSAWLNVPAVPSLDRLWLGRRVPIRTNCYTVPLFATTPSSGTKDLRVRKSRQLGGDHCPRKAGVPSNVNQTPAQGRSSLLTSDTPSEALP